jgi:HEAT repeat protein
VRTYSSEDDQGPVVLREIAKVLLDRGEPLKEEQLVEVATSRTEADGDVMKNPESFIKGLRDRGLLIQQAGGTYTFRHPMITAYLGGESLIHDMEHRLDEVATQPAWDMALGFAAAVIDMLPAVKARLSAEADVLYNNLFSIAHWLPESDPNAIWRGEILKRVSAAIVATSQFPTVRKRALASLVASRDRNVIFIMRQAIRHANPVIRALACVGLGAIGSTDGIRDLRSMVVDDDRDVQMAAAQSLGAIGTDAALEVMVQALLEGDEDLRQAIAEALSAVPGEGYEILRDAIDHQDMMVRRAAVFGLARVPTMWALGSLYRTMLEDSQWYVRSAAERVFTDARDPERQGPQGPPPLDDLTWLRQWAASQGEGIPDSDAAAQLLIRALQQGDQPKVRELAAKALAQQSHTSSVKPLYAALMDKEETVRAEAYEALGTLQMRSTKSLPGIA